MEETKDGYKLSSGREIYANRGIIGISPINLKSDDGWDVRNLPYGYDGDFSVDGWTSDEREELAGYMISLWTQWLRKEKQNASKEEDKEA